MYNYLEANTELADQARFFPAVKDYDFLKDHTYAEQLEALRFDFEQARRRMEKELSRCTKLEDKGLRVLFAGYYKREEQLREQYETVMNQYAKLQIEKDVFTVLES